MHNLKKYKYLYFSLGTTLLMVFYLRFFLSDFSKCFSVEIGINSLGLTFYYTVEIVKGFFESRTLEQLICYREFLQIWDPIFAIVYTLMYSSWIIYFFKNKYYFLVIPILVMIADWVENYIELMMLETYLNSSPISETLVSLGSGINSFKWSLSILTYLIIFIGIMNTFKLFLTKPKVN